jgi:hypothetical protein
MDASLRHLSPQRFPVEWKQHFVTVTAVIPRERAREESSEVGHRAFPAPREIISQRSEWISLLDTISGQAGDFFTCSKAGNQ